MGTSELFLLAMIVILALPYALWRLARTDYWAPLVVVQIVAGILLGPAVLGALLPGYYQTIFTPNVIGQLSGIAQWGVMLFVSQRFFENAPWMAIWPGVAIFVTVLAFNLFGDGLRDALDPKQAR